MYFFIIVLCIISQLNFVIVCFQRASKHHELCTHRNKQRYSRACNAQFVHLTGFTLSSSAMMFMIMHLCSFFSGREWLIFIWILQILATLTWDFAPTLEKMVHKKLGEAVTA